MNELILNEKITLPFQETLSARKYSSGRKNFEAFSSI